MMKKIIVSVTLAAFSVFAQAQGLERITVEKYYISDANDLIASGGRLPVGSVTYRIFADMKPAYRFQAAFGIPNHGMRIATTTFFYNNEKGAAIADKIPNIELKNNTVMLDSWLSVGAASSGNCGVLKTDDNGLENLVTGNDMKALQNVNPLAGIPLKLQDGLSAAYPQAVITTFGIDKELTAFEFHENGNSDSVFATINGSWASFGGAVGRDTSNKVLIAQLTTNGVLSFELNIQIATPDGGVEQYVAKDPVMDEIKMEALTYTSEMSKGKVKKKGKATEEGLPLK